MGNLLFFRRSCAYRHAARTELRRARSLLPGWEREQVLQLARALRDLARDEAWLEGQIRRMVRNDQPFVIAPGNASTHRPASAKGFRLDR